MAATKAIDTLTKAANLVSTKRTVLLANGSEFEFWCKPLTMAERKRAQKAAKSDEVNSYAIYLLVSKAQTENGSKLFSPGDVARLENDCRDEDVQSLMLAMLGAGDQEVAELDMKSA